MKSVRIFFNSLFILVLVPSLLFVSAAQARYYQLGDCGSTWAQRLGLKDSYGGASFASACRNHDKCYDTCDRNRRDCDNAFKSTMRQSCKDTYNSQWHVVQREACLRVANGYHSAVHRNGGDAYRDAQRHACRRARWFNIKVKGSSKCLDVDSAKINTDGANVQQYQCEAKSNQLFRFFYKGDGWYRIKVKGSSKCLDVDSAKINIDGANVQQYQCETKSNQLFKLIDKGSDWYSIEVKESRKCLDVSKSKINEDGANVKQYQCGNKPNQRFKLIKQG